MQEYNKELEKRQLKYRLEKKDKEIKRLKELMMYRALKISNLNGQLNKKRDKIEYYKSRIKDLESNYRDLINYNRFKTCKK